MLGEYMKDFQAKMDRHDKELQSARILSREFIVRIIIICSSAIAFSVSLFSIEIIKSSINFTVMQYAWYGFIGTIIIAFLTLFLEGRNEYARAYRSFQPMGNIADYNLTIIDRIRVLLVFILSWAYPTNLIFCRIYSDTKKETHYRMLNGFTVHYLARFRGTYFILENILILSFIGSLILFTVAVV